MDCVLVLLLLVGFSANALGQASGGCNATCQANCGTRFNECQTNYPHDPTAANACSAVQGVWSCLQQKVGSECRTLSDLATSLQAIESAVSSICDHGRCAGMFSTCYETFPKKPVIQTCDDISTTDSLCKGAQGVLACIQQNLPATCRTAPGMEVSIQVVENATKLYCHPTVAATCGKELVKCMCRTQRPGAPLNQLNDMSALCERWPDARKCFDAIPDSCNSDAGSRQSIESTRVGYELNYYTACDPKGGVCPATLACFTTGDQQSASGSGDGGDTGAEFKEICRMTPIFDCLDNASRTCNINQGTVTFTQIKGLVVDLCDDVLPHADKIFQCPQFQSCVNDTMRKWPGQQDNQIESQQVSVEDMWKATHAGVSVTRTGFWCSALQAVYKCALDHADRCGIQSRDTEPARQQYNRLTTMCVGAATLPPLADNNSGKGPQSGAMTRTQSEGSVIMLSAILITWLSG